jgi:hypothetical protein
MNTENNNIDIEELEEAMAEFETGLKDDRGPTRKQLAKIEEDYSDVLKVEVDGVEDLELSDVDKKLMKRITKYIENVRFGNKISSSEYVSVRKKDDDDDDGEVKELDCNFDRNAGRHFSRMGMFDE